MPAWRELTYRTQLVDQRYVREMTERLVGSPVVVRMPDAPGKDVWRRGILLGVFPDTDRFRVKWKQRQKGRVLKGLWRIHNARLFTEPEYGLPVPRGPARLPDVKTTNPRRVTSMAKATGKAKAASNGGGTRDILGDYTEKQREALAKKVVKMKEAGAKWGEIGEELDLPGDRPSVAGRRLIRDYADREDLIRERDTSGATKSKAKAKPAASKTRGSKAGAKTKVAPKGKTKVKVRRGRGRAANPS